MTKGRCHLTGKDGKYVKAHIIPKALTYRDEPEMPFAQAGRDAPPIKRWDSWYDPALVTEEGEKVLTDYDTWGLSELRKHRLVWRSWGPMMALGANDFVAVPGTQYGFRKIEDLDGKRLRMFLLSILWRAAASSLREFREVQLHRRQLEQLRRMVLEGAPEPMDFFPVTLTQLSTMGPIHNLTPLAQDMPLDIRNPERTTPIFRFYFDGLIAHFYRDVRAEDLEFIGTRQVGADKTLHLATVSYEVSWQRENLGELVREAKDRWPERLARIHPAS